MKKGILFVVLFCAIGLAFGPVAAKAATTYTLQELYDDSDGIVVGDKKFFNFQENSNTATGGASTVDPSLVIVELLDSDPLNPGLRFIWETEETNQFIIPGGNNPGTTLIYSFFYEVETTDGAAKIQSNSLFGSFQLGGSQTGSGFIREDVAEANGGTQFGSKQVGYEGTAGGPIQGSDTDELIFDQLRSGLTILTEVNLTGSLVEEQEMGVIFWDQNFSQVPVPAAVWLLGSGLIGILGLRRKFKKN